MTRQHLLRMLYPLAGIAIILAAWHYYVVLLRVPQVVLPGPLPVAAAMATQWGILADLIANSRRRQ